MKTKAKLSHRFYYMALTAIAVAAPSPQLLADDTDVFFAINEETYVDNKPNIMFIMDENYSMRAPGQFTFEEQNCNTETAYVNAQGKALYCKNKKVPHKCNDKGELVNKDNVLSKLYCPGNFVAFGTEVACDSAGKPIDDQGRLLVCEKTLESYVAVDCNDKGEPAEFKDGKWVPLAEPKVAKRFTSAQSCYDSTNPEFNFNRAKNQYYDHTRWYYIPNNDLSRVVDNTDQSYLSTQDPATRYKLRMDRPLLPSTNQCSDLQFAIDTKGGRAGYFAALYKKRCDRFGGQDGAGNNCVAIGGTKEYGWYPVDVVRREEGTYASVYGSAIGNDNGIGGLNNSAKIVALECLEDMGKEGVIGDTTHKNYIDNTKTGMDPHDPFPKGWTADKNNFSKQPFEYGGIYSGHYLNYLRSQTKKREAERHEVFQSALKRFIEKSSKIRLGLASFKPYNISLTGCMNGGRGEGDADTDSTHYTGQSAFASNATRCYGGGDGGSIDVPVVDIETVHQKWRWLPDFDLPWEVSDNQIYDKNWQWPSYKRNLGTRYFQDYSVMNRDVSHREWLWHQVDQYFTNKATSDEYPMRTRDDVLTLQEVVIPGIGKVTSFPLTVDRGVQALATMYRPLGETLFEVGRYFKGEVPKFGAYSRPEAYHHISEWGGTRDDTKRPLIWQCNNGNYKCTDAWGNNWAGMGPWGPIYKFPRWKDQWGWNNDEVIDTTRTDLPHYQSPVRAVTDESGNVNADPCEANVAVIFTDYTGERRGNSLSDISSVEIKSPYENDQHSIDENGNRLSRGNPNGLLPPFDDGDEGPLMQRLWPGLDCTADIKKYGTCLPSIAGYLADNDIAPHVDGKQVLRTFVVSYWNDNQFQGEEPKGVAMLRDTAKRGKGKFIRFGASLAELDAAIAEIMNLSALNPIGAGTFVAPASTVDFSNRLENKEDIYLSLFEPSETDRWQGNVKRYKIGYVNNAPTIVNANCDLTAAGTGCASALDDTNAFKTDAVSGWGTPVDDEAADGNNVTKKGAVAVMDSTKQRKILTDYCWAPDRADQAIPEATDDCFKVGSKSLAQLKTLADKFGMEVNVSVEKNINLMKFYLNNKIAYLQGYAGDFNANNSKNAGNFYARIGDPLHSQPKFVHYGLTADKKAPQQSVVFFGTNEGYVHAIDVANGQELFAFAPEAAFGAIGKYHDDAIAQPGKKVYGVDGEIETWLNDTNGNGVLDNGEKAYIFFGMRRGGDTYYALDVTDPTAPKLAWRFTSTPYEKNGGTNGQSYHELAQSWAKPVLIKAKPLLPEVKNKNGTKMSAFSDKEKDGKPVARERAILVINAGYDIQQDVNQNVAGDNKGRAIYLVDALTGTRLWAAGYAEKASSTNTALTSLTDQSAYNVKLPDMKYSLAATPAVFDVDGDTYVDTIIAADTGGQIWRVNLQPKEPIIDAATQKITGYQQKEPTVELVAQLANNGGTAARPSADRRRFFTTPDLMFDRTDRSLVIAIGTGRRPKPLDKSVDNRLYVLRAKVSQEYSTNPKVNTTTNKYEIGQAKTLTEADLFDITEKDSFTNAENRTNYFTNGLMLKLGTTYLNGATASSCERNTGTTASGRVISSRVNCKNEGEKIMDNVSIFNNHVIFTSYLPSRIPEFCGAALGDNRFNAISLANPDARDSIALSQHGIAPKPAVMLINDGGERKPAIVVGTEVVKPTDIKSAGLKNLYTLSRDKLIKMWLER